MRFRTTVGALIGIGTIGLIGCRTDSVATADAPPVADGARPVKITGDALAFDPPTLDITAGEELALTLVSDDIEHDLTIDEVDFAVTAAGGERSTRSLRIDTPGTYTAYCSVPGHRAAGMEMTLTVNE